MILSKIPAVRVILQSGLMVALTLGGASMGFSSRDEEVLTTGPVDRAKVCMLNNFVVKAQPAVPYVFAGKTYFFCCAGCIRRFSVDPKRFSQAIDPVTKQKVDKAKALLYAYKDTVYYLSSAKTLKEFSLDPMQYLSGEGEKTEKTKSADAVQPQDGTKEAGAQLGVDELPEKAPTAGAGGAGKVVR